jgi:hypothetical protein
LKTIPRSVLALFFLMLFACAAQGDEKKPSIDPSEHRAAIRQRLLELTPLGEPFANVLALLNEKFASADKASAIEVKLVPSPGDPHMPVKTIRVDLGQYLTSPLTLTLEIPLPLVAETSATWIFDEKDRLVDIVVSKRLESEFDEG